MNELDRISDDVSNLMDVANDDLTDRLAILQLLSLYSHLVDDLDVRVWGDLFTHDASFEIRFARGEPQNSFRIEGRDAIRDSILARQTSFRERGIQRRHYLTNPVVLELGSTSARVMVYLQLANIDPERGLEIEGTGRYDGIVQKTDVGWRIERWRLTADGDGKALAAPIEER